MKPQQQPSAQEVLAGLVERVTFHNAENGFCVLRALPWRVSRPQPEFVGVASFGHGQSPLTKSAKSSIAGKLFVPETYLSVEGVD